MRFVVYLRVSSEEQRERQTIENQRAYATSYARLHSLHISEWYADDGVSGALPVEKRPAGTRLLADARAGRFDTVLIYRVDRLARSTLELLRCVQTLERANCSVRSMSEPFETATTMGKFVLTMLGSIAQLERDTIRERTMHGAARGAKEGRWNGGIPPLGYRVGDEGSLEEVEAEAQVVRRLFRLYQEGMTTTQIAQLLNAEGIPTPRHHKGHADRAASYWRDTAVLFILKNRTYAGERQYRRRKRVHGEDGQNAGTTPAEAGYRILSPNPPLVTVEVFEDVQERIRQYLKLARRNGKLDYLLRGLVRCGTCGASYCGTSAKRGEQVWRYYRCVNRTPSPCPAKPMPADVLEEKVWTGVVAFCANPERVVEALRVELEQQAEKAGPLEEEGQRLEVLAKEIQAGRQRLIGYIRKGLITDADAEPQLIQLNQELSALEARRSALFSQQEQAQALEERLVSADLLLRRLQTRIDHADYTTRREVIEDLVKEIVVETVTEKRKKTARARIIYCFPSSHCS